MEWTGQGGQFETGRTQLPQRSCPAYPESKDLPEPAHNGSTRPESQETLNHASVRNGPPEHNPYRAADTNEQMG